MSIFDKLAEGLEDQSTVVPKLAPGIYDFKLFSIEKKTNEAGTFEWLAMGLQLISEGEDLDGNPMSGAFVNHMLGLTVNDYNSEEDIKREVACFLDCFQGSRDWDETLESYVGLEGSVKIKLSKERTNKNTGDVYPEAAEVARNGFIAK